MPLDKKRSDVKSELVHKIICSDPDPIGGLLFNAFLYNNSLLPLHCSQIFLIMDDSFQFIIESPQHSQGHKKRPRLVTSCDNWYAS